MLDKDSYKSNWTYKQKWYRDNGYWDRVLTSEDHWEAQAASCMPTRFETSLEEPSSRRSKSCCLKEKRYDRAPSNWRSPLAASPYRTLT